MTGAERPRPAADGKPPAQVMAQSGQSSGAEAVIAKAHHGSVSKEQRAIIEDDLKRGRLPCVVATSSLELGIDMGSVDLVIQIESPPSVASALQRVGRAGHQVGEVSRGVLFPKHRGDLAQTAVSVERMRSGAIEKLAVPTNPLDVLAQQVVAALAMEEWQVDELFSLVTRAALLHPAPPLRLRRHPRPAQRPLPERRVRRAAPAHRLGPGDRPAQRAPRRPAARRHQRRHHPRPRPLRRLPRRREGQPGRRARRGDGLRVPGGRHLRARRHQLADRGHHPRPGARHARRRASPAACRSGRATRSADPPSSERPSVRSPASWPPSPRPRPSTASASAASTSTPRPTWSPTSASSARPPRSSPTTPRSSSSGSATSSATGASSSTPPTARRSTPRGRWRSTPGCASASTSTGRRSPPTTAS